MLNSMTLSCVCPDGIMYHRRNSSCGETRNILLRKYSKLMRQSALTKTLANVIRPPTQTALLKADTLIYSSCTVTELGPIFFSAMFLWTGNHVLFDGHITAALALYLKNLNCGFWLIVLHIGYFTVSKGYSHKNSMSQERSIMMKFNVKHWQHMNCTCLCSQRHLRPLNWQLLSLLIGN